MNVELLAVMSPLGFGRRRWYKLGTKKMQDNYCEVKVEVRLVSITRITLRMRDNGCSSSSSSFNTQRESSMSASPRGPGSSTNVPDTADSQSPIGDQVSATPRDRSFALAGSVFSAEDIAGRIPVVLVSVPSTPVKDRAHF
ncbi:hypothetical protein AXG93_2601s1010 [Marchantia polymorpha subsp. ruderalis]|uniref:Uncharacterized protein n=1 Tax=Marchantia polymorpha subsp. ruderalis TaxID=1480154 RepID=A0A176VV49_MARPO|nr:hypothetical protein AXG93_2601s1010 [Marchantia polymorpha subsp. ruderalis]